MLLEIENLGPLKRGTIDFGDITLLMGPPNTGKSYTLKTLYTKMFLLDEYTSTFLYGAVSERVVSSAFIEVEGLMYRATRLLLKTLSKQELKQEEQVGSDLVYTVTLPGSTIITIGRTIDLSLAIDKILSRVVNTIALAVLPMVDISSSTLKPVDASRTESYAIEALSVACRQGFRKTSADAIDITEHLLKLIKKSITRNNVDARKLVVEAKVYPEVSQIQLDGKSIKVSILPKLRVEINTEAVKGASVDLSKVPDFEVDLFVSEVSKATLKKYGESISKAVYDTLADYIAHATGLSDLRFMPSQRNGLVMLLEHVGYKHFDAVKGLYPLVVSSYAYWYAQGRKLFAEGKLAEWQRKLINAAAPLLEGTVVADRFRLLYKDWRGAITDIGQASSFAHEVASVLFPLLTTKDRSLILVEEPEAQLHPRAQVIMALFIAALPRLHNCRIVASTNSDLFAITLAQLAVQRPGKKWVADLVKELIPHVSEGVDELAEAAAESARSIDVKVYEYTEEGSVKQVQLESILSERVPSITEVVDKLISWAHSLEISKAKEEIDKSELLEA